MSSSKLSLTIYIILFSYNSVAQELNCNIQIQQPQVQTTSQQLFQNMQRSLFEFMNNKNWTNHRFENNERIECSILIKISGVSGNRYTATLQVLSNRPIYGTSLQTPMLNYKEEDNLFEFEYYENQSLEFNESRHVSNLTSVLAFYAYIIIGLDYDSFSMEGGTEFFQKAQRILNNAQSSNDKGWKAFEARKQDNRYFLIENLLNSKYGAMRRASYRYHRLGLDLMSDRLEAGRNEVAESLKFVQRVYRQNTNLFIIKVFFDAKHTELVNIFSEAPAIEKTNVYNILKEIDPAHLSEYEKLIKTD
ncbi:MAG: DUF4835 family protein [Bacteroidales bacterium]|nr:DUF4835 family protein [Bacteroidales bacterium]